MSAKAPKTDTDKTRRIPKVRGWRILLKPVEPDKKTESGIILPDEIRDREKTASVCGFVMGLGPLCYTDKERFGEPWCKEGDFVLTAAYQGIRFAIDDEEFRIINDDQVIAVVDDPRGYRRA